MADKSNSGKSRCPTCGATSNNPNIGRDSVTRVMSGPQAKSNLPQHVLNRKRADNIRFQNSLS